MAIVVKRQKGESSFKLIGRFFEAVADSGILEEVRLRRYHQSNGEKKKERLKQRWVKIQQAKQRKDR